MPGQTQRQANYHSAQSSDQTSHQRASGTADAQPHLARTHRDAHAKENSTSRLPSVQGHQQTNASSSQQHQSSQGPNGVAYRNASPVTSDSLVQSTAGHKRKRSINDVSRPSVTPHRGCVLPPPPGGPSQDGDETSQSPRIDPRLHEAAFVNISDANAADQPPALAANDAGRSGTPAVKGGPQPPSRQSTGGTSSNARAAWSQGPEYGRQRLNGKWLPRSIEPPSQLAGSSQPASSTPTGNSLLTTQQVEALQDANSTPHTVEAIQGQPGVSDETAPELNEDAPEHARGGNRDQPIPGLEGYGRQMHSLPATIGSYLHYSNKRLRYTAIPDNIDEIRDKLYVLEKAVFLTSQQIADYWPHMTNIWMRSVKHDTDDFGVTHESWECRHRRRVIGKARPSGGQGTRHRLSKRQMLENEDACSMRIRVTYYIKHADTEEDHTVGFGNCKCIPEWVYMQRTAKSRFEQHNHDIDMLDRFKRSEAMMYFVKKKAEEGYAFSVVANWLHDKYDGVTKQAQYMTKQEVANVAQAWRRANKGLVLKNSIEEPTPEEAQKLRCLDLLHTAKSEGLLRALAVVCERLPEAIAIAMPVLEALQEENTNVVEEPVTIAEGDDIVPLYLGFPKIRRAPAPPPAPAPLHVVQVPEPPAELHSQQPPHMQAGPMQSRNAPPLAPSYQHTDGMVYKEPGGPVHLHDAHGRPRNSAPIQLAPGSQPPAHSPRPPSGPFPAHPARANTPRSGQTQEVIGEAQASRTFQPPYHVPTMVTTRRHSSITATGERPYGRAVEGHGHPAPIVTVGSEKHAGEASNSNDPDAWRPSWLKPIDDAKVAKNNRDDGAAAGASDFVAKLLQEELGAYRANGRMDDHDRMVTGNAEALRTSLAKELEPVATPTHSSLGAQGRDISSDADLRERTVRFSGHATHLGAKDAKTCDEDRSVRGRGTVSPTRVTNFGGRGDNDDDAARPGASPAAHSEHDARAAAAQKSPREVGRSSLDSESASSSSSDGEATRPSDGLRAHGERA
ncbi:hypothetical protein LTR36_009730 [Oleoguttula mirabilis]|uniref:Uncharacterized protein n=1 Tax=Oleoguttula mirabilis TaxID=1507867 RepID=A0AAV9J619_9PEZI|nr:hypothetical protein LTR36_009730 [Oleoguttula mirabilis]